VWGISSNQCSSLRGEVSPISHYKSRLDGQFEKNQPGLKNNQGLSIRGPDDPQTAWPLAERGVVVDAVSSEPVSGDFPVRQGKYREILGFSDNHGQIHPGEHWFSEVSYGISLRN